MKFDIKKYYHLVLIFLVLSIFVGILIFGKIGNIKILKENSNFALIDIDYILMQIKKTAQPEVFSGKPDDAPQRKIFLDNFDAKVSELEKAVDHLADECRCTILVRGAVVAGEVPDLTDEVLTRLGLEPKPDGGK